MRLHRWPSSGASTMLVLAACSSASVQSQDGASAPANGRVEPGITVLLSDSLGLIAGKRVALLTNQTGIDRRGRSDVDLLVAAGTRPNGPRLVSLFAPEHGIRGTEDRTDLASGRDERTGLPIHSLYGRTALGPPDSTLEDLDALIVDLQDVGTRTWTYVASMVYAMRSAARNDIAIIVLDRPNPVTATHAEGPMLDSALANAELHSAERAAKPFALYPLPLRHGLTMGEMAQFYNDVLRIGARLHVVPVRNYQREMWFDETDLPWVRPSPNMPSLTSAILYPGLVAFEGTNLSVGRGTAEAFQQLGAPWLDTARVLELLRDRHFAGARFAGESFTPLDPTDQKYGGRTLPGIRIVITNRNTIQPSRIGAALLWAIARTSPDSLRVSARSFDERFGSSTGREALMRGDDPDSVIDATLPAVVAFRQRTRQYWLYR